MSTLHNYNQGVENTTVFCIDNHICKRGYMEDTFKINTTRKYKYFAVFDGHGGSSVSKLLAEELDDRILDMINTIPELYLVKCKLTFNIISKIKNKIIEAFIEFDKYIFRKFPNEQSGSTAIVVIEIEDYLFCCNLGDSRAIFVNSGGLICFQSEDHKPSEYDEYRRIVSAGGYVTYSSNDVPRVNGILSLSRAFGDFYLKSTNNIYPAYDTPINAIPKITAIQKVSSLKYMVLVSDGVLDVLNSRSVIDIIESQNGDKYSVCSSIVKSAFIHHHAKDNVTVMVVGF